MKAALTRVSSASVTVDDEVVGSLSAPETGGILALVGVSREDVAPAASEKDTAEKVAKMARKIAELRILDGERSVSEAAAPVLVVSQFTLYGDTGAGRRPSWIRAARPEHAEPLVAAVVERLGELGATVATGRFRTEMRVALVNDGPVTVILDV